MPGEEAPITVCVVDDDRDALRLTADRLERESSRLRVRATPSAADALAEFEDGILDCIVSDHHLDDTTGVEFLRNVREHDPDFPFILLTGTGTEAIASEAISAGATDYLIQGFADNQYEHLAKKIASEVDRRRAEREAERTERQLRELAENTNDVLWMFSADWSELLFVNSAYEDLFGDPPRSLYEGPHTFLENVHPDDQPRVRGAMKRISEGHSEQVSYRIPVEDDRPRWVESQGEPILDESGAVVRVVGFTRDITARKRNEEELEDKNDRLELFSSVVAHDLRNPLNVAQGNLELVRGQVDVDTDRLDTIERAHERINQLVTDLLTLARQGEVVDDHREASLRAVANRAWSNVAHGRATLRIETDALLECDPSRLGQAFENLFRNAVEHGDDEVTVTVGVLEDGGGFYVEDDGPGIDQNAREQLLTDERQVEQGDVHFGVAIVKRIVEAHGWTVDITDGTEGGARFEIENVDFENVNFVSE